MAKPLSFVFKNTEYQLEPVKLERKKLYGWTEKAVYDPDGQNCKLISIDATGSVLIPSGGLGQGIVDEQGCWVERSELMVVDVDGNPAAILPSSFDAPIQLEQTVTVEDFLDHYITAIYTMQGEENCPDFVKAIAEGPIYTFDFNYRASHDPSAAFLMENGGEVFLLVGKKGQFDFVGLDQAGFLEDDLGDEESDDDDSFDFGMM